MHFQASPCAKPWSLGTEVWLRCGPRAMSHRSGTHTCDSERGWTEEGKELITPDLVELARGEKVTRI